MSDEELVALLEQSRTCNAERGITGLLLYHNEAFMQYIEGEKSDIEDLFDRIVRDERHTGVTIYIERPIEERNFADWSMGFRKIEDADVSGLEGFSPFLEEGFTSEVAKENPTMAMRLLLKFKEMER